jgi:hypothetical protein
MADCVFKLNCGIGVISSEAGLLEIIGVAQGRNYDDSAPDLRLASVDDSRGFTQVRSLELALALEKMAAWIRTWAKGVE